MEYVSLSTWHLLSHKRWNSIAVACKVVRCTYESLFVVYSFSNKMNGQKRHYINKTGLINPREKTRSRTRQLILLKATNLKQSVNAPEPGIIREIEIDLDNQINLIPYVGAVEQCYPRSDGFILFSHFRQIPSN